METAEMSAVLSHLAFNKSPYYLFKRPLHETAPLLEAYHQTEKKQRMAMK